MSITTIARLRGKDTPETEVIEAARKSKAAFLRYGASDFRLSRVYTGAEVDMWEVTVTYDNWEAYGKAQQALADDQAYQALHGQVRGMAQFVDRRVLVGVEL